MTTAPVMQYIDWPGIVSKFVKQFKISDHALCHIKLQCFSRCSRFDLVRSLSLERRPPIGFKPFALVCIE